MEVRLGHWSDGRRSNLYLETHSSDLIANLTATRSQMDGAEERSSTCWLHRTGGGLNDREWRAKSMTSHQREPDGGAEKRE